MQVKIDSMLSIFKEIQALNPSKDLLLSGSLALHLQGMNLRRDPEDLDICTCYGVYKIQMPKGAIAVNATNLNTREYKIDLCQYLYKGVKIDILPTSSDICEYRTVINSYPMLLKRYIVECKLSHALFNTVPSTIDKHKEDLMYILKHN